MTLYWKSIFDYLDADFLLDKLQKTLIVWFLATTQVCFWDVTVYYLLVNVMQILILIIVSWKCSDTPGTGKHKQLIIT